VSDVNHRIGIYQKRNLDKGFFMSYPESKKPILTKKGVEVKAPRHYDSAKKKEYTNTLCQPLVAVDPGVDQVKTVTKALVPRNPIDEIKNIRNRYQGEYAIVREAMQNSERAGRSNKVPVDIIITITSDKLRIEDNAGGVNKRSIDAVFNLGQSGWKLDESTSAFGQGFMSFILLFNRVEIISNDVNAEFDWSRIESEYNKSKSFDLSKAYTAQESSSLSAFGAEGKFIAIFTKPVESYDYNKAIEQAKIYAKTLPVRSIIINGEPANNKIDFTTTPRHYIQVYKSYRDGVGIQGYFAPGTDDDALRLYFQGLPVGAASSSGVDNYFYKLPSLRGDVNINTTFYGRPSENRDSWIMDSNIEKTINIIRELAKEIAISIIDKSSESTIEEYQHFISTYSTFEDIKYHIRFEVIAPEVMELVQKSERAANPKLDDKAFEEHMKGIMGSSSALNEAIERAKGFSEKIDTQAYNEREQAILKEKQKLAEQKLEEQKTKEQEQIIQQQEQVLSEESQQIQEEKTNTQQKTKTAKDRVDEFLSNRQSGGLTASKWNKETFWVERDMAMVYMTEISNATYHHIPIAFAENRYQKQLFKDRNNFHYISELKTLMTNTAKLSSAGAKNSKERRIEYIMKVFIDAAGFKEIKIIIANIEFKNMIQVPHSTVKIETPMEVAAYAEGKTIYFHRKLSYGDSAAGEVNGYYGIESLYPYFVYNDFDLEQKSIGQGDIAVFSKIRKLLAHEMAHVIYHTTDNTDTHYKAILEIDSKFDTVISEFKSSSVVTDSQTGISKKAKERIGLQPDDNIVLTYTKGSKGELEKQIYTSPTSAKHTKKDIFYYPEKKRYYTYEEILSRYSESQDILQSVLSASIPIGYKLGDYVAIKTTSSNAYETKETTISGKLTEITISGLLKIKFDDGYTDVITHEAIVSKANPPQEKYSPNEILVDDTHFSRTWVQLKKLASERDVLVDDFAKFYKSTGLMTGDRVKWHEEEGKIQAVENGYIIFYRDSGEIDTITEPNQITKLSSSPPPSSSGGTMQSIFDIAYGLIKQRPMTYNELIASIPELGKYAKPQNSLWTIIKKFGIDKGLVEYTSDKPVKIKVKGM